MTMGADYDRRHTQAGHVYAQLCDETGVDPDATFDIELDELGALSAVAAVAFREERYWVRQADVFARDWVASWLIAYGDLRRVFIHLTGATATTFNGQMQHVVRTAEARGVSLLDLDEQWKLHHGHPILDVEVVKLG